MGKFWLVGTVFVMTNPVPAMEVSGSLSSELRVFAHEPSLARQRGHSLSLSAQPEFYHEWNNGDDSIAFVPFARLDNADSKRTHVDIRELWWQKVANDWELRVGLGKVFWGVTESRHLVDIINQSDLVENIDGEDKLGQPMINYSLIRQWGTVDVFVLPGFRERTFPGAAGRLRGSAPVDTSLTSYDSGDEERHIDLALRWSHTIGEFDIGLSHFYGTSREPRFLVHTGAGGLPALAPHYDLVHQTGVDVQATIDSWLWKFEAIHRSGQANAFLAAVAGFEYTFYGVSDSSADLGVLVEYLVDSRGDNAPQPFEHDVLAGMRLALNDAPSSEVLAGVIFDLDGNATTFSVEASRRLGARWKLEAELRAWTDVSANDPLFALRNDDHIQITVSRFF